MALYRRINLTPGQHAYLMALAEEEIVRLPVKDPAFDLVYSIFSKLRDAKEVEANGCKPKP
jgi:hypothetical protein